MKFPLTGSICQLTHLKLTVKNCSYPSNIRELLDIHLSRHLARVQFKSRKECASKNAIVPLNIKALH